MSMQTEISRLRSENKELRVGITSRSRNECGSSSVDRRVRILANDIRTSASSAEISLR